MTEAEYEDMLEEQEDNESLGEYLINHSD